MQPDVKVDKIYTYIHLKDQHIFNKYIVYHVKF